VSAILAALEADAPGLAAALDRLRREDALGQLVERRGRAAELATEGGDVKLDWVDGVARALADPAALAGVEELAASIGASGVRHLVWSGMGGSVQTVHALAGAGLLDGAGLAIHPLDSTDPAALNRLLLAIAAGGDLAAGLASTLVVAVSMGMTSEEPVTHLEWFEGLLRDHAVAGAPERFLVMTLPGSSLDAFARERGIRRIDLQLDGRSHTPGRMSAPATRVFLLPAALALPGGGLRALLERCQAEHRLARSLDAAGRDAVAAGDPFVRLAAWLGAQMDEGRDMLLLDVPERWRALAPWVEQVVEESLGKGGRGLLVFPGQDLASAGGWPDRHTVLRLDEGEAGGGGPAAAPARPVATLRLGAATDAAGRLAVAARFFAGWEVTVALLGYLRGITFAGQPAVEGYKRHARELRTAGGPLPYPSGELAVAAGGRLALDATGLPGAGAGEPAAVLAAVARAALAGDRLAYLDLTVNADPDTPAWDDLRAEALRLGNRVLRRPVKLRSGPRDYHSTEQSETDGPPGVLSLRVLVRRTEPVAAGDYSERFLHAQALGTVRAMREAGRPPILALIETPADAALLAGALRRAGELLVD
jgi:transaldolase/glucose-6-phosphate isomerase